MFRAHVFALMASSLFGGASLANDPLEAFPAAGEGMVRHVLKLAEEQDESLFKVELLVGKTMKLDAANRYFFGGGIQAETVEGWGYTKYVVKELGPMAGTLIAVDPDAEKVDRFITLGGEPYLIRYNSRMPVVVYVPDEVQVRFRIWRADPDAKPISQG